LFDAGAPLDLLPGMAPEGAGHGELAQLVPDHVLGDEDRDMLAAVMHQQRVPDKVREDGRAARPGLDRLLLVARVHPTDLFQQLGVGIRPLLQRTSHRYLQYKLKYRLAYPAG